MIKKVLVTGGSGRFGSALRKIKTKYKIIYPTKKQLDILRIDNIRSFLKRKKPKIVIHMAGLSRPMDQHEKEISRSINLNIIGTSNLVIACSEMKVKIIYISTSYVYPNKGSSFRETDPVLPWNNYGWSKLGAECAVQMYKNSLIVRACVSEKPFLHKTAFNNVKASFLYHDDAAKIVLKLINKTGMINLGGKSQTIFNFAKKTNPSIKKSNMKNNVLPKNLTISLSKLKGLL